MSDLDKLFSDYEKISRERQTEINRQHELEHKQREDSAQLLRSVILPVLQRISAAIKQKGHKSDVQEKFDNRSYPSATLSFTPSVVSERSAHVAASNLSFTYAPLGGVEMRSEIKNDRGSNRTNSHYNAPKWEPFNFTEIDVESQAVAFVAAVLKAN